MENLNTKAYDLARLKEIRHWMHENAELSLQEFNTHKKIKEFGLTLGVPEDAWVLCTKTGWRVDIKGKGPASGKPRVIACRSDHDGLPNTEQNPHLSYKSKTNAAHLCGHDGHTTCLLGGMALLMDNLEKIPSDRTVRFMFQPAEEGFGGAGHMIKEGILEGVDEVYGCHNLPNSQTPYKILISDRECMAHMQILHITIHGKGGHGSSPEKCNNPIPIACRAYLEIVQKITEYKNSKDGKIRFSLASFNGGSAFNVIPSSVLMKGSTRDFNKEDSKNMVDIIRQVLDKVTSETDSKYDFDVITSAEGAVINHPEYAEHVRKSAIAHYGADMVSDEGLPIYASEDFADFLFRKPGCFFFRVGKNLPAGATLHSDKYDFDDEVIDDLSKFWFRIIHDRLNAE
jgi:hippurate hydrolase